MALGNSDKPASPRNKSAEYFPAILANIAVSLYAATTYALGNTFAQTDYFSCEIIIIWYNTG